MRNATAFKNSINKAAEYTAIQSRLAEAITLFGCQSIGLHLVDAALKGALTPTMLAAHEQSFIPTHNA
jgi:hypothetical protein